MYTPTRNEEMTMFRVAYGREVEEYAKHEEASFVSMDKRRQLAKDGNALPDGSYPIENPGHLKAAITLAQSGHGDVAAAKRLIKKRAKDLGREDMLPASWKGSENADAQDGDTVATCPNCGYEMMASESDGLGTPVKLPGSASVGGYR